MSAPRRITFEPMAPMRLAAAPSRAPLLVALTLFAAGAAILIGAALALVARTPGLVS